MELIELKAQKRTTTGKGANRTLRREGRIPAVMYGPAVNPESLSVDAHDLEMMLKDSQSSQMILKLAIEDMGSDDTVMVKELQTDPVSNNPLHVDFYKVAMDQKIRVNVPVQTFGKSKGVELGGMLQVIRRELEIMCLPLEVPEAIKLDVTDLDIGDSIHVEDITTEGGIEIPHDVNFTVITVLSQKKAEAAEELEEGEEAVEGETEADAETAEGAEE